MKLTPKQRRALECARDKGNAFQLPGATRGGATSAMLYRLKDAGLLSARWKITDAGRKALEGDK